MKGGQEEIMGKTQDAGLLSHTTILQRLVKLGYEVVIPWSDSLGYNLAYIVNKEETHYGLFKFKTVEVVRIQCKTAWLSKDGSYIEFNTTTLTNRLTKRRGYKGVAERFGVYSPHTGKVYMVSVNERGTGSMKLRLHPTRNGQEKNVRWAKDYEF
jgi:hypothetical protein